MTLHATIRPKPLTTQILVTEDGDDILRAVLPTIPAHPRALETLLEGLALWRGTQVHAVLTVEGPWGSSLVDTLLDGGQWPLGLANVQFRLRRPRPTRRLRGPGDFRELYRIHRRSP